jgi:hypothetical protein
MNLARTGSGVRSTSSGLNYPTRWIAGHIHLDGRPVLPRSMRELGGSCREQQHACSWGTSGYALELAGNQTLDVARETQFVPLAPQPAARPEAQEMPPQTSPTASIGQCRSTRGGMNPLQRRLPFWRGRDRGPNAPIRPEAGSTGRSGTRHAVTPCTCRVAGVRG